MKRIIFAILLLPLFLNPADNKPEQAEDPRSFVNVTLNIGDKKIDETSKKQLALFLQISKLVEEINQKSPTDDISDNLKNKLSDVFKKTSDVSKDIPLKKYLNSLSVNVLKGTFFSNIPEWHDLSENEVEIILKSHPETKRVEVDILLNNKEFFNVVKKYISVVDKMLENVAVQQSFAISSKILNPIRVFDIYFSSSPENFISIYPDNQVSNAENPFKILVYTNVMKLYFNTLIKAVSNTILEKKWADCVDFGSYFSNLIMHRISHYLGPSVLGKKAEEITLVDAELKDLFYSIEEIRADTMAITNVSVLIKGNIIPKEKEKNIYATYVAQLLEKLRDNQQSVAKLPLLIQLNYILKNEGIIFDINKKKISLKMKELKRCIKELMLEVTEIERIGSYSKAEIFIKKYNYIPSKLREINKNLRKVPLGIRIECDTGNK